MTVSPGRSPAAGGKSGQAFRTIGEVAETLDLPQHVLRFWETRFSQIRPLKRGGNRRYYRPEDVDLLRAVKTLLYEEGYTIKGVQKRLREQGVKATVAAVLEEDGGRQRVAPAASGDARAGESPAPEESPAPRRPPTPAETAAESEGLSEILEELKALRRLLD